MSNEELTIARLQAELERVEAQRDRMEACLKQLLRGASYANADRIYSALGEEPQ